MELNMIEIGERIKKRRNELGLTQTDIHNLCGMGSGILSRIERGKIVPSITSFYSLSSVLKSDINWLLTGSYSTYKHNDMLNLSIKEENLLKIMNELNSDEKDELLEIAQILYKRSEKRKNLLQKLSHLSEETDIKVG